MTYFSRFRDEVEDDLESQVKAMRKEIAVLRKALAKRGSRAYDETGDFASMIYDMFLRSGSDLGHDLGKQAQMLNKTARDNPVTTAVVGLAALGLLAGLLFRR